MKSQSTIPVHTQRHGPAASTCDGRMGSICSSTSARTITIFPRLFSKVKARPTPGPQASSRRRGTSEQQLQRELNLAGSIRPSHCGDLAKVGVAETHLWSTEDR